eukprot:13869103-Alexandrium_andersonii.AAC.1
MHRERGIQRDAATTRRPIPTKPALAAALLERRRLRTRSADPSCTGAPSQRTKPQLREWHSRHVTRPVATTLRCMRVKWGIDGWCIS